MDLITIKDLEVFYHVGVPDEERQRPQKLLVTIEMEHDFSKAAKTDAIADTIDYYAVSREMMNFGEGQSWKTIEKLASDIADLMVNEFRAASATIEVKKFVIQFADYVSVRVTRIRYAA